VRAKFVLFFVFCVFLAGCKPTPTPPAATATRVPPTATPQKAQPTALPTLASTEPTTAPKTSVWEGLPDCQFVGTGSSQPMNKDGKIPVEQSNGMWTADLSKVGCALIFEGRLVKGEPFHRIIVLRDLTGTNAEFVIDGKFTYAEGSIWGYDRTWNLGDFSTEKPPIAAEFLHKKVEVMKAEDSLLPINVYLVNGQVLEFPSGEVFPGVTATNDCDFSEPQEIPVHGEFVGGKFAAAIGALGCTTVAWIDGAETPETWSGQRDGERKVVYTTITAWMMPSGWTQDQINTWIASK